MSTEIKGYSLEDKVKVMELSEQVRNSRMLALQKEIRNINIFIIVICVIDLVSFLLRYFYA